VKASDDLPMEWYRAEATRIVREKLAAPGLEIQVFSSVISDAFFNQDRTFPSFRS